MERYNLNRKLLRKDGKLEDTTGSGKGGDYPVLIMSHKK